MAASLPLAAVGQVLLVEDDDAAREMFAAALRLAGYHVRTAPDGVSGIRLIEFFKPDVIVLDLGLPGATGFEVLHELRSDPRTRRTPVIAVSGHDRGVRLAQANPEFFAILPKPFDPDALVRLVTRALRLELS
jgi:CheY-like chemotaxis protein